MENDVYVKLAEYLDKAPIGAPLTDDLMEILKVLYTPEEAELATKLPFMNADLPTLVEMTGMEEDELKDMLIKMAKRGTVFMNNKGYFRLLPTMVGFFETPFGPGKRTPETKKLAGHWYDYLYEAYGREIADRKTPLARVVAIEESIEPGAVVTPFEKVDELMDMLDFYSVAHCPCRQMAEYSGQEHCDHNTENCFHFGSMGRYMVSQGMARELTREEAKELIKRAHEEGLVHVADNYSGRISTLCSCCGDCCVWMRAKKELNLRDSVADSNYVMVVDEVECIACGVCEERCPVDAITMDDFASVDTNVCIGCGVCYPTCQVEAISLVKRGERKELVEVMEYVQKLMDEKGI